MTFKRVQTIEGGDLCLTIVPGPWEETGTLWWPNQRANVGNLLKNPESIPDKSKWDAIACVMKRTCSNYKAAERELKIMENNSDTEAEVAYSQSQSYVKKKPKAPATVSIPNMNEELLMVINTKPSAKAFIEASTNANEDSPSLEERFEESSFLTSTQLEHIEIECINEGNIEPIEIEHFNGIRQESNDTTNIFLALNSVLKNQEKIIYNIAKIQNQIDMLGKIIGKINIDTVNNVCLYDKKNTPLSKPIRSQEELQEFENKLKNDDYMQEIIESITFICGSSGRQNGLDCCYKLIDYFFDRKFLTSCSWTGNTRATDGTTKIALKFFTKFRVCFLNLILKADNCFGEKNCDEFFKRILKNSQQRQSAKGHIESKHKCRPKNLVYKKSLVEQNTPCENITHGQDKENVPVVLLDNNPESNFENVNIVSSGN